MKPVQVRRGIVRTPSAPRVAFRGTRVHGGLIHNAVTRTGDIGLVIGVKATFRFVSGGVAAGADDSLHHGPGLGGGRLGYSGGRRIG